MAKKKEKQILRVLAAVELGAETSAEVEAVTDLPLKHCSYFLGELVLAGLIRRVKKEARRYSKSGRMSHLYQPLTGRVSALSVGPLTPLSVDTYVSSTRRGSENLGAGFLRPDKLATMRKR